MRLVWIISIGMTLTGTALIIAGKAFDLDPLFVLAGMLTLVAGIVKLVIAQIWSSMLNEPAAPEPPAQSESRLR